MCVCNFDLRNLPMSISQCSKTAVKLPVSSVSSAVLPCADITSPTVGALHRLRLCI